MTLDEAIEILKELPDNLNNVLDYDQQNALLLGRGALEREKRNRKDPKYVLVGPLPGETEE
jgi:hypothetical protein